MSFVTGVRNCGGIKNLASGAPERWRKRFALGLAAVKPAVDGENVLKLCFFSSYASLAKKVYFEKPTGTVYSAVSIYMGQNFERCTIGSRHGVKLKFQKC